MGAPSAQQLRLVRFAAIAVAVFMGLVILISIGSAIDDPDSADDSAGWIVALVLVGAVPFLPLALRGLAFRVAAALIGLAVAVCGFALIGAVVGAVLLVAGLADLVAAFLPATESRARAQPR